MFKVSIKFPIFEYGEIAFDIDVWQLFEKTIEAEVEKRLREREKEKESKDRDDKEEEKSSSSNENGPSLVKSLAKRSEATALEKAP